MIDETKICKCCNEEKRLKFFRKRNDKYCDYMHVCRKCEIKKCSEIYYAKKSKIPIKKIESLDNEIWVSIPEYDGYYECSNLSRIKSLSKEVRAINYYSKRKTTEKLLKFTLNKKNKYWYVSLHKGGVSTKRTVHTIIADCFIPNPLNLPEVNHKNGNRQDCSLFNLERCTTSENSIHKYQVLGYKYPTGEKNKLSKGVFIIYPDGHEEYVKGVSEAGRRLGASGGQIISKVINGERNSYKGHKFRYEKIKQTA